MDPNFGIFWSYAHHDNEHDQGKVLRLAELLEGELRSQGVRNFPIWRDRVNIVWGDNWREKIIEGVHGAVFFMPVVSPAWYQSHVCMEEIDAFIRNEHLIGDGRCILPISYIDTGNLDPPHGDEFPDVKPLIDSRQWQCWREHRFSDPNSRETRELIAGMAISIRDRLEEINRLGVPSRHEIAPAEPSEANDSLVMRLANGLDQLRERLKSYSASSNVLPQSDATRLDRIAGMVRLLLDAVQPAGEGDVIRGDTLEALYELQEELRICFDGPDGNEISDLIEFDDHDPVRRAIASLLAFKSPTDPASSGFDNEIENALITLIEALDSQMDKPMAQPVAIELLRYTCQRWLDHRQVEFDVLHRRMKGLEPFRRKGATRTVFELTAILMGKALDIVKLIPGAIFADVKEGGECGPLVMMIPGGQQRLGASRIIVEIKPFGWLLDFWSERQEAGSVEKVGASVRHSLEPGAQDNSAKILNKCRTLSALTSFNYRILTDIQYLYARSLNFSFLNKLNPQLIGPLVKKKAIQYRFKN